MELGLERVEVVADRMELRPPCFYTLAVAGTNGKGSTVAMLEAILHDAGYKVGAYASPHMLTYNERVRTAKQPATDDDLCTAFEHIEHIRGDTPLTYFEFGTLAALQLFSDKQIDVAMLEVGLGGRLDAVNVLDAEAALLTCIGVDHTRWLGQDRENIGREKAGIFRRGCPAICSDPEPPASVPQTAAAVGARFLQIGRDYYIERESSTWRWRSHRRVRDGLPYPAMRGDHQLLNAAGVLMALETLTEQLPVTHTQICSGLRAAVLPGRFQVLPGQPVRVLDVAHNGAATTALTATLKQQPVAGQTFAVLGMLEDKPMTEVVATIDAVVDRWYLATLAVERGASAQQLYEALQAAGVSTPATLYTDANSAYRAACDDASERECIVVFGSFYTVSDILSAENKGNAIHGTQK